MEEITRGCVLRHKRVPEVKVWVVAQTWPGDKVIGIAMSEVIGACNIGDTYSGLDLENWEVTDEFYDVAEIVTKMQKGEE